MVTWLIVSFNLGLALIALGLTLRVWRWRHQLLQLRQVLTIWLHQLHHGLPSTAQTLDRSQIQVNHWQRQYIQWQHRRRQIYQLLALIGLGQRLVIRVQYMRRRR